MPPDFLRLLPRRSDRNRSADNYRAGSSSSLWRPERSVLLGTYCPGSRAAVRPCAAGACGNEWQDCSCRWEPCEMGIPQFRECRSGRAGPQLVLEGTRKPQVPPVADNMRSWAKWASCSTWGLRTRGAPCRGTAAAAERTARGTSVLVETLRVRASPGGTRARHIPVQRARTRAQPQVHRLAGRAVQVAVLEEFRLMGPEELRAPPEQSGLPDMTRRRQQPAGCKLAVS